MTRIKLCGLTRLCDIEEANSLLPDYIGFVFAAKSKRYISPDTAGRLREALNPSVCAVGVFVREAPEQVARLLNSGVIDLAQLHGGEDEQYIEQLRSLTDKPVIRAFRVRPSLFSGGRVGARKCGGSSGSTSPFCGRCFQWHRNEWSQR